MGNRLLVINCAALGRAMVSESAGAPALSKMAAEGRLVDLQPSFPAVTCSVQATLVTGRPPSEHGIVANGFYAADWAEVRFWEQSANLVGAPAAWTRRGKASGRRPTVAMMFWQNSMYADVDWMMTPRPLHTDAGLVNDCYGRPAGLYAEVREAVGEFPLMKYWGPMAGIESSEWIARATEHVWRKAKPDVCLTYLPHLDYNTQRLGPEAAALAKDVAAVDGLVARLAEMARADGAEVVVLSEYSLSAVRGAVALNRVLREAGLVAIREVAGREYLDAGACRAFAMVDHQLAHVYCPGAGADRAAVAAKTRDLLRSVSGVAEVLDAKSQAERGIRHARSGDLVCVSEADRWFSYGWWTDAERAPDFARTVDIHRKPGYDPVELFFDPATRSIPLDESLVKGSHGRAGPDDPKGVLLATGRAAERIGKRESVEAGEVMDLLLDGVCG